MKLTTAEFADNADSVEALTAKQKLLQKQFDEQAKKAEAAEKALKKLRDNGIAPVSYTHLKLRRFTTFRRYPFRRTPIPIFRHDPISTE